MNNLQAVQLNILKEVSLICTKHDIPYSLGYGTALGAVRHKGFIPWDDDIDIVMMRKDFEKFENVWANEAPDNIFLQTYKSDPFYPYPFAKIRDSSTTFMETGCEHLNINHGVFIDIFPFDYLPKRKTQRLLQLFYAELVWILARKNLTRKNLKGRISSLFCFLFSEKARKRAMEYFQKKASKYPFESAIGISNLNYGIGWASEIYSKDSLLNLEQTDFEDSSFLLMKEYDAHLKVLYGDYMTPPPVKDRTGHAYIVCDTTKPYLEVLQKSEANLYGGDLPG